MQDFYLEYGKIGTKYLVRSNLTKNMMRNAKNYEEFDLRTLSVLLNVVNSKGDAAKSKFKDLCEKNGDPLHNALLIYNGIYDDDKNTIALKSANILNDLCENFLGYKPVKF